MKHLITLLTIAAVFSCNENAPEPGSVLDPRSESSSDTEMSFEEIINSDGRYMFIDQGNRHFYFDDGKPSCPDENELNQYAQISLPPKTNYISDPDKYGHLDPPPITNYNIYHGRNGHFYYENPVTNINYMIFDHLVDDKNCIRYFEVIWELCENGQYRYCVLTKEDCYINDLFLGTTLISEWCSDCNIPPHEVIEFRPWNVLCEAGFINHN